MGNNGIRSALVTVALVGGWVAAPSAVIADDRFDQDEVRSIEEIVRDYILANPEIISEANQILEARKEAAKKARARELISANMHELVADTHSFVAGNPDGDVTVVEFFDYRCPYCRGWMPKINAMLEEDPNIRLMLKEYPILRPDSLTASQAAIASIPQGNYKEFHNALLAAKGTLSEEAVMEIAAELGLDTERLKADIKDIRVQDTIDKNKALAKALELLGSPTFIVGDQFFEPWLSVDEFKAMIAAERSSG